MEARRDERHLRRLIRVARGELERELEGETLVDLRARGVQRASSASSAGGGPCGRRVCACGWMGNLERSRSAPSARVGTSGGERGARVSAALQGAAQRVGAASCRRVSALTVPAPPAIVPVHWKMLSPSGNADSAVSPLIIKAMSSDCSLRRAKIVGYGRIQGGARQPGRGRDRHHRGIASGRGGQRLSATLAAGAWGGRRRTAC